MEEPEWLQPPAAPDLTGDERFVGLDATVRDFWRFAMGDLRMNNARGYLAEFLVAQALGLGSVSRIEWDAYDLLVDGEIRVEVKSSAYLQAWEQRQPSRISFSGLRGTRYDPRHSYDPAGKQLNAHVYVFCLQAAPRHDQYRPLDRGQWEFFVVGKSALERHGQSIGLSAVTQAAGGSTAWDDLLGAVRAAATGETVNEEPWWEEPPSTTHPG
jgi:hypothetical protein